MKKELMVLWIANARLHVMQSKGKLTLEEAIERTKPISASLRDLATVLAQVRRFINPPLTNKLNFTPPSS